MNKPVLQSIPILTYHSNQVDGDEYASNDHLGLQADLALIDEKGWSVVSVDRVVDALLNGTFDDLPHPCLAITCDDGSWLDWYDLPHPTFGPQRGFRNILRDFVKDHSSYQNQSNLLTSFVIVSPDARASLDRSCLIGQGWWGDEWWPEARDEGLISVQNHSWDHKHSGVDKALRLGDDYGAFHNIRDFEECHWQIDQAQDYLNNKLSKGASRYFAYPYGHCPAIVADEYLPGYEQQTGIVAAFTTEPEPITADSDRWRLPRYVFRRDWKSPAGLRDLLDRLGSA